MSSQYTNMLDKWHGNTGTNETAEKKHEQDLQEGSFSTLVADGRMRAQTKLLVSIQQSNGRYEIENPDELIVESEREFMEQGLKSCKVVSPTRKAIPLSKSRIEDSSYGHLKSNVSALQAEKFTKVANKFATERRANAQHWSLASMPAAAAIHQ